MKLSSVKGHGYSSSFFRSLWPAAAAVALVLPVAGCGEKHAEVKHSNDLLIEARQAITAGDTAKAIEALNASIEAKPNTWALFELAQLQLGEGDEQAALASCDKGLELDPESADILWLKGEIEKPEEKRFKGRFKFPPSQRK